MRLNLKLVLVKYIPTRTIVRASRGQAMRSSMEAAVKVKTPNGVVNSLNSSTNKTTCQCDPKFGYFLKLVFCDE